MAHRTGRATKLTPQIQESIVRAVTAGVPVVQAAQLAGIGKSTVLQWLQRGAGGSDRRSQPIYVAFVDAITRARALDEARRLARLELAGRGGAILSERTITHPDGRVEREVKHAPPDWRTDEFYLERAYQDRWGRRVQADMSLEIRQLAQDVAEEIGVPVDQLLAEAQAFLKEHDARRLR